MKQEEEATVEGRKKKRKGKEKIVKGRKRGEGKKENEGKKKEEKGREREGRREDGRTDARPGMMMKLAYYSVLWKVLFFSS